MFDVAGLQCTYFKHKDIDFADYDSIISEVQAAIHTYIKQQKLQALTLFCNKMSLEALGHTFAASNCVYSSSSTEK